MPATYWGVTDSLGLVLPRTAGTWLLLALYGLLFGYLLIHGRAFWPALSRKGRLALLLLAAAGLAASHFLPLTLNLPALIRGTAVPATAALLSAVPYLLAGVVLGPVPALLVGFATGLGRAAGGSGLLAEPFQFAFAAWLAAHLLRQTYDGRLYRALRFPPVAGLLSSLTIVGLTALSAFAAASAALLVRLDAALQAGTAVLPGTLLEGLVGGAIVAILLLAVPEWRPRGAASRAPGQRSIDDYLVTNVLLFGLAMLAVTALFAFSLSLWWSTRLHVAELVAAANAATIDVAAAQSRLEDTLLDLSRTDALLLDNKVNARALGEFQRANQIFEQVIFVDQAARVLETVPAAGDHTALSAAEQTAVTQALSARGSAARTIAQPLSVVVSLGEPGANDRAALVGRVDPAALGAALGELGAAGNGRVTAVLSQNGEALLQVPGAESQQQVWAQAASAGQSLPVPAEFHGAAHLVARETGGRTLVYLGPPAGPRWRVGVAVPYTAVLAQALAAALPLLVLLLALTGAFYARTRAYGRDLSRPIAELAGASRTIASGGSLPARPAAARDDEIGELDRAFADMHHALKRRLDELSLLLTVSQEAAASIDLDETMPVVLQGAIRGTGAATARAVILNPNSGYPLTFAAGAAAPELAGLDRALMGAVRQDPELVLRSEAALADLPGGELLRDTPYKALCALRLGSATRFKGFLLLVFRQAYPALGTSELALLRTLAGQAALLIEKSYLFSNAEGGRRRLAAVLASTSEAVIVTDQTLRILIINRSLEKAFGVQAGQVIGRSIHDVIPSPPLVEALAHSGVAQRNVEIEGRDRRTYFANASPITGADGQVLGRVAVLHDITHLKEVDRAKSEFVDNVSHDLRTPLTVLSGYATALSMLDDLTPEQRDYSDHIVQSVERMTSLVENLLDLGRIEAGVDLVYEDVAVPALLQGLADEHWLYAHESGLALRVRAAQDLPPLQGDRMLLNQALANLLTNAFKYAPDSGEVVLGAELVGGEVLFSVADRGPGIAGQDQIRLFEKFYRVKRHGAGKAKGSGLGLAIVRGIAARHNGRVWCESELGQGSTFYLAIPLRQPE